MAYTSGDLLVRTAMQAASGLPADEVVNDFAFQFPSAVTDANITDAFAWVDNFYRETKSNGRKLSEWISNQIARTSTHSLLAYQITAGPLGSPLRIDPWLGPDTATVAAGLPTEVCGVLSFHADMTGVMEESGATRPKARRRGRVFIGPLTTAAIVTSAPPYVLDTTFLTTLRLSAIDMMDQTTTGGAKWCVWSRKDAVLREVVGGWTDNAPDIQRRRGFEATSRVNFG